MLAGVGLATFFGDCGESFQTAFHCRQVAHRLADSRNSVEGTQKCGVILAKANLLGCEEQLIQGLCTVEIRFMFVQPSEVFEAGLQPAITGGESLGDIKGRPELGFGAIEITARKGVLTGAGMCAPAALCTGADADHQDEGESNDCSWLHSDPPGEGEANVPRWSRQGGAGRGSRLGDRAHD